MANFDPGQPKSAEKSVRNDERPGMGTFFDDPTRPSKTAGEKAKDSIQKLRESQETTAGTTPSRPRTPNSRPPQVRRQFSGLQALNDGRPGRSATTPVTPGRLPTAQIFKQMGRQDTGGSLKGEELDSQAAPASVKSKKTDSGPSSRTGDESRTGADPRAGAESRSSFRISDSPGGNSRESGRKDTEESSGSQTPREFAFGYEDADVERSEFRPSSPIKFRRKRTASNASRLYRTQSSTPPDDSQYEDAVASNNSHPSRSRVPESGAPSSHPLRIESRSPPAASRTSKESDFRSRIRSPLNPQVSAEEDSPNDERKRGRPRHPESIPEASNPATPKPRGRKGSSATQDESDRLPRGEDKSRRTSNESGRDPRRSSSHESQSRQNEDAYNAHDVQKKRGVSKSTLTSSFTANHNSPQRLANERSRTEMVGTEIAGGLVQASSALVRMLGKIIWPTSLTIIANGVFRSLFAVRVWFSLYTGVRR